MTDTTAPQPVAQQHPDVIAILEHFAFDHLPPHLAEISMEVHDLAHSMADQLQHDPQLLLGLQHLLEAKDCLVRVAKVAARAL